MSKPTRPYIKPQSFHTPVQRKTNQAAIRQAGTNPVAPPVYRPQPPPKVLQRAKVTTQPQLKPQSQPQWVAPPVYKPQPGPKVLQKKTAVGWQPQSAKSGHGPVAPPAYRPQPVPKVLQMKSAINQTPRDKFNGSRSPQAPPAYRPQPTPKVLQGKSSNTAKPTPNAPHGHVPTAHRAPNSQAPTGVAQRKTAGQSAAAVSGPSARGRNEAPGMTVKPSGRTPFPAPHKGNAAALQLKEGNGQRPAQHNAGQVIRQQNISRIPRSNVIQGRLSDEALVLLGKYLVKNLPSNDIREYEELLQEELWNLLGAKYNTYEDAVAAVPEEYERIEFRYRLKCKVEYPKSQAGKQVAYASASNYDDLKKRMDQLLGEEYKPVGAFATTRPFYIEYIKDFTYEHLQKYKKLQELVKPFLAIKEKTLNGNPELTLQTLEIFSWLIPLQDETVKGLPNKDGLMKSMKMLLSSNNQALKAAEGNAPLPDKALIRNKPPVTIQGYKLGVESEIITAKAGAILSGEKAEIGRDLESLLTQHLMKKYVAGHMVAGSLGGKFRDDNLTPITNTFNTADYGMAGPENEARKRLNENKVIRYKTTVKYGNASKNDITAVLPTQIKVEITTLGLREGGNPKKIRDYIEQTNPRVFTLIPL